MDEKDLEQLAGRELGRLPAPRAPETLLPRVLAAVDAWSHRPWYTRAWFSWPLAWQAISIVAVAMAIYGVFNVPAPPAQVVEAAGATRALWRAFVEPLLPYLVLLVVVMVLACAAVGVALNYVLLERAKQR